MRADVSLDCIAQREGAAIAVLFAHGLDGDAAETWGAFPSRLASEAPSVDVFNLGWPAALARFIAEPGHTAPALAGPIAETLCAALAPYRHVHLVLHCLGAIAVFAALRRREAAPLRGARLSCTLLDAPLLSPDRNAPAWLERAMTLMGLTADALSAQTRWAETTFGERCVVLRGADHGWVNHCSPFALGAAQDHHRIALSHIALAAAPAHGPFAPLDLTLAQLRALAGS